MNGTIQLEKSSPSPRPCPVTGEWLQARSLLSPALSSRGGEGEDPHSSSVTGRNVRISFRGVSPPRKGRSVGRQFKRISLSRILLKSENRGALKCFPGPQDR